MYSASVTFDDDVVQAIYDDAQTAPARLRTEMGKIARGPIAQAVIAELSKEPDAPNLPIQWTSQRQHRYVMMKLRRSGNIPYKRSHRLSQGWRVVLLSLGDDGGTIGVQNSAPQTDYVQGENQQRFLSKWPLARTVIRGHEDEFQDAAIDAWYRVTGAA